ncbi:MAG: hypothetical protein AAGA53_09505 [Pseudomonadota bacterium]
MAIIAYENMYPMDMTEIVSGRGTSAMTFKTTTKTLKTTKV